MPLKQITDFTQKIADLNNRPNDVDGLTGQQLKERFDKNAEVLRVFLNTELIDKLNATSGVSGAELIGSKTIPDVTGATVFAQIASLKQQLDGKAGSTDFLKKDNTDPFTPTGDYNPSTKKYVDDTVAGVILGQIPDDSLTEAKMVDEMKKQAGGVYPYNDGATNRQNIQKNTTSIDRIEEVNKFFDTSGTASALTVDTQNNFEFNDRNVLRIVPNVSNTGVVNITVDSEDAVHIKKFDADSDAYIDLEEGDVVKNTPIQLVWDNSQDFFVYAPKGGAKANYEKLGYSQPFVLPIADMSTKTDSYIIDAYSYEQDKSKAMIAERYSNQIVFYLLDLTNLSRQVIGSYSPNFTGMANNGSFTNGDILIFSGHTINRVKPNGSRVWQAVPPMQGNIIDATIDKTTNDVYAVSWNGAIGGTQIHKINSSGQYIGTSSYTFQDSTKVNICLLNNNIFVISEQNNNVLQLNLSLGAVASYVSAGYHGTLGEKHISDGNAIYSSRSQYNSQEIRKMSIYGGRLRGNWGKSLRFSGHKPIFNMNGDYIYASGERIYSSDSWQGSGAYIVNKNSSAIELEIGHNIDKYPVIIGSGQSDLAYLINMRGYKYGEGGVSLNIVSNNIDSKANLIKKLQK